MCKSAKTMCKCGLVIMKNLKFDLWMDLMILHDSILFPPPFEIDCFLGQIVIGTFSGIAVSTPLFGPASIDPTQPGQAY